MAGEVKACCLWRQKVPWLDISLVWSKVLHSSGKRLQKVVVSLEASESLDS